VQLPPPKGRIVCRLGVRGRTLFSQAYFSIMETKLRNLRNNLKQIRKAQGMTQQELSEACGFDRTYVGKIERGERVPSLGSYFRLIEVLGVDAHQLYGSPREMDADQLSALDEMSSPILGNQYLQWLRSVINLEQNNIHDPHLKNYLNKLRLRLDTLNFLYSKSVQTDGKRWIDCKLFMNQLTSNLSNPRLTALHSHTVRASVEEGIELKTRDIFSLSLVLNEMLYETTLTLLPSDPRRVITLFFEETTEERFRASILVEPPVPPDKIRSIPTMIENWALIEEIVHNEIRGELDLPEDHTEIMRIEFDRPRNRRSDECPPQPETDKSTIK